MLQRRVRTVVLLWSIASAAIGAFVAYLALLHPHFYRKYRFKVALAWRISSIFWPTFLFMMTAYPMKIIDRYPLLSVIIATSFITNAKTTIMAPMPLHMSLLLSSAVSIRQLFDQYQSVCSADALTIADSTGLFDKLFTLISSATPLGFAAIAPTEMVPHAWQCMLVFATLEIAIVLLCWWAMQWIDASNRIAFLRRLSEEALDLCSGRDEKVLFYDPLASAVRTLCIGFTIVATLWLGVVFVATMMNENGKLL